MAIINKLLKSTQNKWVFFMLVACVGALVISIFVNYSYSKNRQNNSTKVTEVAPAPQIATKQVQPGVPLRLKIPIIGLDASVIRVGLTPGGDLDAPKAISDTGWYEDGVRPGEAGTAVMDGHYGWINKQPAIFNNLDRLQKGDELYVEDESGASIKFIVRGYKLYAPNENASAVFYSDDGKARLNLITCQGTWESSQKSYSTRLVVFTEKEVAL